MLHVEELIPVPDPWHFAKSLAGLPHLLFLDSANHSIPSALNRYSFVTADPFRWITGRTDESDCPTFEDLQTVINQYRCDALPELPPFQGGIAGLFGYNLGHLTERLPRPKVDEFRVPDLAVGIYDWVVAWDHLQNKTWIISRDRSINQIRELMRSPSPDFAGEGLGVRENSGLSPHPLPRVRKAGRGEDEITGLPQFDSNFTKQQFESSVSRIIEYIHAGDCFQVNLAQRLLAPASDPLQLYGRLRTLNEAPFAAYFDIGEFTIASASPERFLKVDSKGQVETRPIKGTRARHPEPSRDAELQRELQNSAKDRAENVMIVDLLRNDIGKVCEYGSIKVNKVCQLESYRTVHHLVSEVVGKLRSNKTAVDLLKGAFPGGSITGAPKIRAMEIIAELEPTARGPYCGSLGYLGFDGSMDTNILIRTFTIGRGYAQFPVGAGIVADSDPAHEYEETFAKAEGLLRALQS